ncbi:cytochrome c oxidase subunit 3 [Catenovulum maritimum]|uniref:cytochrome-c oxidase n=1 Tax=Catenovulum maritimum TaxID=1513271 RepID=A0A0J8GNJ3_9ALTE|nr:cytochrome c oxidase subunit 3 [Catenovulum maritimum]KMT64390.1 MFS transporter [Catenovulum maritimum]
MTDHNEKYYVPEQSPWPIVGAIAFFLIAVGAGNLVAQISQSGTGGWGRYVLYTGIALIIFMLFGWFRDQIKESTTGMHNHQLGVSYRQGMSWFIFSEVMFFAAFFGALFYTRTISVPWLAGAGNNAMTAAVLWPNFEAIWPLTTTPSGQTTEAMGYQGLPLINTLILLVSSITVHFAHTGLELNKRGQLKVMLAITVLLGCIFLALQVMEYIHAYRDLDLRLDSGVYGNTFYLLTGFHGLHVFLGTVFLFIMLLRIFAGHFDSSNHFAFQAASWYWHFVDVVWLCLFIFVYIL